MVMVMMIMLFLTHQQRKDGLASGIQGSGSSGCWAEARPAFALRRPCRPALATASALEDPTPRVKRISKEGWEDTCPGGCFLLSINRTGRAWKWETFRESVGSRLKPVTAGRV